MLRIRSRFFEVLDGLVQIFRGSNAPEGRSRCFRGDLSTADRVLLETRAKPERRGRGDPKTGLPRHWGEGLRSPSIKLDPVALELVPEGTDDRFFELGACGYRRRREREQDLRWAPGSEFAPAGGLRSNTSSGTTPTPQPRLTRARVASLPTTSP